MNDNVEEIDKKEKRQIADNTTSCTNVNDYIRFITYSDNQMKLEYKNNYTDGTSNWIFEGWYTNEYSLIKNIIKLVKNKKLKLKEESDLKYFLQCYKDAKNEILSFFKY